MIQVHSGRRAGKTMRMIREISVARLKPGDVLAVCIGSGASKDDFAKAAAVFQVAVPRGVKVVVHGRPITLKGIHPAIPDLYRSGPT